MYYEESLVDVDVLADPDALVLLDVLCESLNDVDVESDSLVL